MAHIVGGSKAKIVEDATRMELRIACIPQNKSNQTNVIKLISSVKADWRWKKYKNNQFVNA